MSREELFDRHLRGELNGSEAAELKHLLATDPAAGRAFVEYVNETNLLVRVGSQLQSTRPTQTVIPFPGASHTPARRRRIRTWAALAACLLALAALGVVLSHFSGSSGEVSFHVSGNSVQVTRDGTTMAGGAIELEPGDVITTPTNETAVIAYEHESTRVEVFPGTVVLCGDPSSGKNFELRRGGIQAGVAPQPTGKPMLVTTPQARATVVGTRFLVRTDERATKIDVFEGQVELANRAATKSVMVKAGYWASSTASGPSEVKALCKCSKCRGTNEPSNCPNLKKKNDN